MRASPADVAAGQSPLIGTPEQRRHADLVRTERTMVWVRALGAGFGVLEVLTYGALPYPPGYREAALWLVVGLAAVDIMAFLLLLVGWPRTPGRARALAVATVGADTLLVSGLVWAYSFDPDSAHWAIMFVLPLLGAARFQLTGALSTWAAATALYTARQAYAAAEFEAIGFSATSIVFRMGLALLVALVAGLLARDLARERERTADALTELERVDRLRSHLVDSLAHDMRSPLTAIAGALAAVERGGTLGEEQRHVLLALAQRQTGRLSRLATGMLDLAKLEQGRLELAHEPVRLRPVVDNAIAALDMEGHGVTVDVPDELEVTGDADRLDQMLFNLLSNAVQHGAPPVEVSARQRDDRVVVRIVDHGAGVPPEQQPQLFEPFTTNAKGGVGLGLWLVRALTEAHGGSITYRDGDVSGAVFELQLPAATSG